MTPSTSDQSLSSERNQRTTFSLTKANVRSESVERDTTLVAQGAVDHMAHMGARAHQSISAGAARTVIVRD